MPKLFRLLRTARFAAVCASLFAVADANAQIRRERGHGPYTLETSRGEATVRLIRRDREIVWVDRLVKSGEYIETGVPAKEIIELRAPRPRIFELADEAETEEQISLVIDELRRMSARLKPFQDLPGVPVNESLILQAKLNERREYWRDAFMIYERLLEEPYEFDEREMVGYWAGICLWNMDKKEEALEYLMKEPVPDEDLSAMSEILYARADGLASVERHREAAETYLQMIVFYPYTSRNEVRALRGIIPSYVEMGEWDAVMKSVAALKADYPDARETAEAEEWLAKYSEELEKEKQFQVPIE